jgi:hypothetical protein
LPPGTAHGKSEMSTLYVAVETTKVSSKIPPQQGQLDVQFSILLTWNRLIATPKILVSSHQISAPRLEAHF